MRISIFVILSVLFVLPNCLVFGQLADGGESLQDSGNGEIDVKNEDLANEEKEEKPRKTTFKEERFEKLFNNRHRKPRLPAPKNHQKPKSKLPSFIKNPVSVKPLGQDGLPVDDTPRPTVPSTRVRTTNNPRSISSKVTTSTPRTRSKASTTTTTQRPSINDSNKRFSSLSRGRTSSSSSNNSPSIGSRGSRLN